MSTLHRRSYGLLPLVIGFAVTIIAGLIIGLYQAPALADPGTLTRWALPLLTFAQKAVAALTLGAFLIAATVYSPSRTYSRKHTDYDAPHWQAAMSLGRYAAFAWPLVNVLLVIVTYSSVAAMTITDDGFGPGLWQFITEIELGQKLAWSVILTILVSIAAAFSSTLAGAAWCMCLSVVALIPIALTGHSSGVASHTLAVSSIYLHIIGISAWVGGLIALLMTAPRNRERLKVYASRYSAIAGWSFVIVAYSGILNAFIRFNNLGELVTTGYGRLLALKIVATAALGVAGLAHRRRTIAQIENHERPFLVIAWGEAFVMGGVVGLAAVMRNSAPPIPQTPVPDPTPTFLLSQYPVPPYPETYRYVTEWRLEPLLAFFIVTGIVVYLRWATRLKKRGDHWSNLRTASWITGLLVFGWVTNGGPAVYGSVLFSSHMFMHMMLAMVIPIFLALGAPVTLLARGIAPRTDGSRSGREIILAVAHSRYAAFWSHPIVAGINFSGSLILFYFTSLFYLSLTTHVGHLLMILHFTLAGYMFVNALVGIDPGPHRPTHALRIVVLFATMAFHAFFGIAVISSTALLANEYFGWLGLPWGVDALADQEVGGALTWGIGEFPTVALAISVAVSWTLADKKQQKRIDRQADRDDDAELKAYNEMLARLNAGQ